MAGPVNACTDKQLEQSDALGNFLGKPSLVDPCSDISVRNGKLHIETGDGFVTEISPDGTQRSFVGREGEDGYWASKPSTVDPEIQKKVKEAIALYSFVQANSTHFGGSAKAAADKAVDGKAADSQPIDPSMVARQVTDTFNGNANEEIDAANERAREDYYNAPDSQPAAAEADPLSNDPSTLMRKMMIIREF